MLPILYVERCSSLAFLVAFSLFASASMTASAQPAAAIDGELKRYHPVTVTFDGPHVAETTEPNPFLDYRLSVIFRHLETGERLVVPGYFAADGNAADTGAGAGSKWRAHLTPSLEGRWSFEASFRTGDEIAVSLNPLAGEAAGFDGSAGAFTVGPTDKTGRDFRGRGMLRYVGQHYLRFDDGSWFVKGGPDSPETLLAYADFDGTSVHGGEVPLKTYAAHERDWNEGDPTWANGRGKGLIGALNYLAEEGLNAFSFLPMNVTGDGKNVWPWIAHDEPSRYDVSKLDQWERVFSHADSLGLYLHFKTQETENDLLLDGGELGTMRKLYYRELVARFGHHLALNWNLGEENDIWEELDDPRQHRIKAYAEYIRALDPYDHPIVIHTYPNQQVEVYVPLLGPETALSGASVQTHWNDVHEHTLLWRTASQASGKKWVVANDEQGDASTGVKPDGPGNNHDEIRHETIWGHLLAGGAGNEFYFGYQYAHNDLNLEDFRSRDVFWDQVRHALDFFNTYLPFWEMEPADWAVNGGRYALAKPGEVYAVYVPNGDETTLNLASGTYSVDWYDPRNGGALRAGEVQTVEGSGTVSLGAPPAPGDWVALVRAQH